MFLWLSFLIKLNIIKKRLKDKLEWTHIQPAVPEGNYFLIVWDSVACWDLRYIGMKVPADTADLLYCASKAAQRCFCWLDLRNHTHPAKHKNTCQTHSTRLCCFTTKNCSFNFTVYLRVQPVQVFSPHVRGLLADGALGFLQPLTQLTSNAMKPLQPLCEDATLLQPVCDHNVQHTKSKRWTSLRKNHEGVELSIPFSYGFCHLPPDILQLSALSRIRKAWLWRSVSYAVKLRELTSQTTLQRGQSLCPEEGELVISLSSPS